jgi:hypothetical protein
MTEENKYQETYQNIELLNNLCDNIVNETLYDHQRDWTQEEIDLFVDQFRDYQEDSEDTIVDMDRLDPNFITFAEMKKKFPLFDDNVIEMLCECENKKLEDARIPPLIVRNENVTLTDNLSTIKYIDDKENSKSETISSTNSESGDRGVAEEEEQEKEEASV